MAASEAEFTDDGGGAPRLRSAVDEPEWRPRPRAVEASLTRPDWQKAGGLSQRLRAMGPATAPEMVLAAKSFCLTRPAAVSTP